MNNLQEMTEEQQECNRPIDSESVRKSLSGVMTGRAVGVDDIPNEVLKWIEMENCLAPLYELCRKWKMTPRQWKEGIVVPIYKKGDRLSPSNYRGITLLSCVGKLYSRILDSRLRNYVEKQLVEEQAGFRKGYNCMDNVFILSEFIQQQFSKTKKTKKTSVQPLRITFVDFEMAMIGGKENMIHLRVVRQS